MIRNGICPYCGQEMEKGYITTDANAVAWRKEKHESALVLKKSDGIQIAKNHFAACNFEAYCCRSCKKVIIEYGD